MADEVPWNSFFFHQVDKRFFEQVASEFLQVEVLERCPVLFEDSFSFTKLPQVRT